jgi:hypothetical protein
MCSSEMLVDSDMGCNTLDSQTRFDFTGSMQLVCFKAKIILTDGQILIQELYDNFHLEYDTFLLLPTWF